MGSEDPSAKNAGIVASTRPVFGRFSGCDPRRSENIECNRVVTVTWVDGELSHGTWTGDQAASIRERAKCWNGSKGRAGRAPS